MKRRKIYKRRGNFSKLAVFSGLLFWFSAILFLSQVVKINEDSSNYFMRSYLAVPVINSDTVSAPMFYDGKIVIIIDDIGREMESLYQLAKAQLPFTISILPNLKHSKEAAIFAHENGWEVMMHVPMEPLNYPEKDPGADALMSHMNKQILQEKLFAIYENIPYAKGFNNHMGSRLTALPNKMQYIMKAANQMDIFFIDSKTTKHSSALRIAVENEVAAAERTLFIDSLINEDIIMENVQNLMKIAGERGFAIAICHAYPETLRVLSQLSSMLNANNKQLVHASMIVYSKENKAYLDKLFLPGNEYVKKAEILSSSFLPIVSINNKKNK